MTEFRAFDVEGTRTVAGVTITVARGRVYGVAYIPEDPTVDELDDFNLLLEKFPEFVNKYTKAMNKQRREQE